MTDIIISQIITLSEDDAMERFLKFCRAGRSLFIGWQMCAACNQLPYDIIQNALNARVTEPCELTLQRPTKPESLDDWWRYAVDDLYAIISPQIAFAYRTDCAQQIKIVIVK